MGSYNIEFKPSVHKDFRHLPKSVVERTLRRIEELGEIPFLGVLRNWKAHSSYIDFTWVIIVLCTRWTHESSELR